MKMISFPTMSVLKVFLSFNSFVFFRAPMFPIGAFLFFSKTEQFSIKQKSGTRKFRIPPYFALVYRGLYQPSSAKYLMVRTI